MFTLQIALDICEIYCSCVFFLKIVLSKLEERRICRFVIFHRKCYNTDMKTVPMPVDQVMACNFELCLFNELLLLLFRLTVESDDP